MFEAIRHPWRSHAELDGLSDTECRAMLDRRWRRDPPAVGWWWAAALAAAGAWAGAAGATLRTPLELKLVSDAEFGWVFDGPPLGYAAAIVVAGGGGLLVGAMTLRLLRFRWERRTLARIVAGATCPRCRHSLIGLPIIDDSPRPEDRSRMRVRCPECGKLVGLTRHGYGPQDLAPWAERVLPKNYEVRVKR